MAKPNIVSYETDGLIIKIDRKACISCGTCEALAPKTFKLDSELKSTVKPKPNDSPKKILEAAQSCPVEAIIIEDQKTNKTLWPK